MAHVEYEKNKFLIRPTTYEKLINFLNESDYFGLSSRHVKIIYLLLNAGPLNTKTLAENLSVDVKTIRKLIDCSGLRACPWVRSIGKINREKYASYYLEEIFIDAFDKF